MKTLSALLACALCVSLTAAHALAVDHYGDPSVLANRSLHASHATTTLLPRPASWLDHEAAEEIHGDVEAIAPGHHVQGDGPYVKGLDYGVGGCYEAVRGRCGCWYGSVAGLIMTRDDPNRLWLTSEATDPTIVYMSNRDAGFDWRGGFEVTLGTYLSDCTALEVTYWMLDQFSGHASFRDPTDGLVTPIDVSSVWINGTSAATFFDNAREHRVWRSSEFHNLELNLVHEPLICNWCNQLRVNLIGGVRFFRFDDDLTFASVEGGWEFGSNGGANEAYLEFDTTNNLIGLQLGARADYYFHPCWRVFATPKIGLYANHITNDVNLRDGVGNNGDADPPGPAGQVNFPLSSHKNDVAFLAEIDLGVVWEVNCRWNVFASYRAVAATGVALADTQVPQFLADTHGMEDIDSNGSLILHGLRLGAEYRF